MFLFLTLSFSLLLSLSLSQTLSAHYFPSLSNMTFSLFVSLTGRMCRFPADRYVLRRFISLINIAEQQHQQHFGCHKQVAQTSQEDMQFGASESTDLLGDKEMASRTVASCLTLSKFLWLFSQKGQ